MPSCPNNTSAGTLSNQRSSFTGNPTVRIADRGRRTRMTCASSFTSMGGAYGNAKNSVATSCNGAGATGAERRARFGLGRRTCFRAVVTGCNWRAAAVRRRLRCLCLWRGLWRHHRRRLDGAAIDPIQYRCERKTGGQSRDPAKHLNPPARTRGAKGVEHRGFHAIRRLEFRHRVAQTGKPVHRDSIPKFVTHTRTSLNACSFCASSSRPLLSFERTVPTGQPRTSDTSA